MSNIVYTFYVGTRHGLTITQGDIGNALDIVNYNTTGKAMVTEGWGTYYGYVIPIMVIKATGVGDAHAADKLAEHLQDAFSQEEVCVESEGRMTCANYLRK